MIRRLLIGAAAIAVLTCSSCSDAPEPKKTKPDGFTEITFDASDHKKVFADFYPSSVPNTEKVVLMFHQAGSNAGEYQNIEPTVASLGYSCIAIDQRSGGDMWGRANRTASKSGTGDYMDAYSDLKGALEYAQGKSYTTIVLWGSSYSASLALKLADEGSGIKAVIVFSPGEYFDDKGLVKTWASKVTLPTLFACTPEELKDGRQEIYDAIPTESKTLASFHDGVHGSTTLIRSKSAAAAKYMDAVKLFLSNLRPQ